MYVALDSIGGRQAFLSLGVQVLTSEGQVYTIGNHDAKTKTDTSRLLGQLAGAQAMVTGGSQA